ncbi:hypothetical protein TEA_029612 [Camellia sinensis var. sinensis]|uniref:Uncharacterized protein n=1 Tax=Camellia sinensis var. sinensis TaxID=542762 RepID=A0A4S4DQ12_CAMSN|nr:hypothetical protein TEA_029612 [Camellia sinensis var. sinensis]
MACGACPWHGLAGQGCSRRTTRPVASTIPLGNAEFRFAANVNHFRVSRRALCAIGPSQLGKNRRGGMNRSDVGLNLSGSWQHGTLPLTMPRPVFNSESTVRCPGKAPRGAVPSLSPGRHAATRSRRGSSSSSPPIADGFGTGAPVPSPQSQSFSRSYGSILPTSLAYILPSTRGCSPWRLDAVMSTTGRGRNSVLRIFKGRRGCTGHHATCGALPAAGSYLRLSCFQIRTNGRFARARAQGFAVTAAPSYSSGPGACPNGRVSAQLGTVTRLLVHPASPVLLTKNGPLGALDSVARLNGAAAPSYLFKYRCGPPSEFPQASPHSGIVHHLSGPDRHARTRTLPRRSKSVGGATREGIPSVSFLAPYGFYSPVDSHTCQTPWSVFQDGPNGELAGRRQERTDAEARPRACAASHDRGEGVSAGFSTARALASAPIRTGPRPESIGGPAGRHSTSYRGASPGPIRFPPDNFKHSLTLFSKSFSSFPRDTCLLSVSRPYLALDGIYRLIRAAFPNNLTRGQRLMVRQGPGTTGLSPSSAPLSRGLGPGPPLRTLLQTTIRTTGSLDFQAGCFPIRSSLLGKSLAEIYVVESRLVFSRDAARARSLRSGSLARFALGFVVSLGNGTRRPWRGPGRTPDGQGQQDGGSQRPASSASPVG